MHPRRSGLGYRRLASCAAALAIVVLEPGRARGDHAELNAVSTDADPAIHGQNFSVGTGVVGRSDDGIGVEGTGSVGVKGSNTGFGGQGIGVLGSSVDDDDVGGFLDGVGVLGRGSVGVVGEGTRQLDTPGPKGVFGRGWIGVEGNGVGEENTGVEGHGTTGVHGVGRIGVKGSTALIENGVGVLGTNDLTSGIGMRAEHTSGGIALEVDGRVRFSTAGSGQIFPKTDMVTVSNASVTSSSHVTITLTDNPGNKIAVSWVERQPGVGFTAHLTDKTSGGVHHFTYLIVEP